MMPDTSRQSNMRASQATARASIGSGIWAGPRRTTAAVIRDALRAEIVNLKLRPGQPVSEKELGQLYHCSRTPVREALMKLAEEGLIDVFPQSGTFVSRIPLQALPEALVIRRALEETAARLAGENASSTDIDPIAEAMHRLKRAASEDDIEAFHQHDEDFHAAIAAAAGYPGIWRLTQQVKLQVDRFRRLTLPQEGRMARVLVEHQAVLDAISRSDGERAALAMGDHVAKLLADLGDVSAEHPDFFDMGEKAQRGRGRLPNAAEPFSTTDRDAS